MVKIIVFDSGLGSLSVIKKIKKKTKSEIIYFADQKNFPYGKKSIFNLRRIIKKSIFELKNAFEPDIIVVGSNTLSLLFADIIEKDPKIVGVFPPLKTAERLSNSSIAILATKSIVNSRALINYIKKNVTRKNNVIKINASPLVDLVESGRFTNDKQFCKKKIKSILSKSIIKNNVDVVTLSSTHLPFLLPMLREIFPTIAFLDPAQEVANRISKIIQKNNSEQNTMKVFTSGNVNYFQRKLEKMGIKNKVSSFFI